MPKTDRTIIKVWKNNLLYHCKPEKNDGLGGGHVGRTNGSNDGNNARNGIYKF